MKKFTPEHAKAAIKIFNDEFRTHTDLFVKGIEALIEPEPQNAWPVRTPGDPIHSPSHYSAGGGIEPLEFIMSNSLGFCEGNIIKYVVRYKHKNGLQDLYKAREYLNRLIEKEKQNQPKLAVTE